MPSIPFRVGVHVSISGGIEKSPDRAQELGCSAMQIFSRNPRRWTASPLPSSAISAFRQACRQGELDPIIIHTPYLLNLGSGDDALHRRSIQALAEDMRRAEQLGARFVVTHLGSGKERNKALGIRRVAKALRKVLEQNSSVGLLVENSSGGGAAIGSRLEEIGEMIERAGGDSRLAFCFDSCHGFSAGYDFRSEDQAQSLVEEMEQTIGLKRLALLHVNDSVGPLGSHLDRHQHIGEGQIGMAGFKSLLSPAAFRGLPMILETPQKGPRDDVKNLSRLRKILSLLDEEGRSRR